MKSQLRRLWVLAVAYVLLLPCLAWAQPLDQARTALRNEDFGKVRSLLQNEINANSKDPMVYYFYGLSYILEGNTIDDNPSLQNSTWDKSKEWLTVGTKRSGKSGFCDAALGHYYFLKGNRTEALKHLEKAEALASSDVALLLYLAETYTVGGKPEDMKKSEQLLLLARSKDPNNAEVYVTLGNLYFAKKPPVYDLSMDNYNKAVQLRPDFAEGFFRIGLMQKAQQKYAEAVEAFKKAISLDAKYAPAYRELSEVYNLYGKYEEAITNMKKYLDFSPGDKRAQYLYAKALFSAQKYQDALNVIQKIDTITPVLKRLEGYILAEFGKYAEAKKAMDQFFGFNHPLIIANDYQVYGKILLKLGDLDQAAKNFEKAVAMDNSLATEVYTQFAELYKEKGDKLLEAKDTIAAAAQYDKAIENYMRLASQNTQDYKSLVAVAQLQSKVNRLEDAYKTYQKLVSQFGNWVYAHKMLARAAFQLDPDYKKGLVVEPYNNVLKYGLDDKATNKTSLIEAASALSYYYINVAEDFAKARQMVELLLELDTANTADHQETLQYLKSKG